jgi:hypothetical protein
MSKTMNDQEKNNQEKQKLKLAKSEYKKFKDQKFKDQKDNFQVNEKSNVQSDFCDFLDSEVILEDDYPVYYTYIYIIDGIIKKSPPIGTVFDLKKFFNAKEVRRCDIVVRLV